jgi:hypothetical protein
MKEYPLMGQYAQVLAFIKPRRTKFSARSHDRTVLKEGRVGMVVGYRTVYDGMVHGGIYRGEDSDPPWFEATKSIKVLLVCFWPTYNPVLVLPEDASDAIFLNCKGLPLSSYYPSTCAWSDKDKQYLRKEMSTFPRDSKGRWLKLK